MPVKRSAASSKKRKKSSPRKKEHGLDQDVQELFKLHQQNLKEAAEKSAEFLRKAALDARDAIFKQSGRSARNQKNKTAASDPVAASALLLRQATDYLNQAMESVSKEINSRLTGQPSSARKRAPARRKK